MNDVFYIDNHIHGSFGINFNYADYDEIKYVLKKLYELNIRAICPTLVGDSKDNIIRQLSLFKKIRDEQLQSLEKETYVAGVHLEGTFLSPNKSGIQDKNLFLKPDIENFKHITGDYEDIIKIVTIAPESDEGLIEYLNSKNIITQAGHSIGSEIKGCKGVTHIFNAMSPIHHRNNSIALSALVNDDIYVEIIADLIHTNEDILKLLLKTKPKDKILLISDSLPSSNYNQDIVFCGKKINKFGKDDKGTLAGSNKTLDSICCNLIEKNIISKEDIKYLAFYNQIKYLNLTEEENSILLK